MTELTPAQKAILDRARKAKPAQLSPAQRQMLDAKRLDREMSFDGTHPVQQEAEARGALNAFLSVGVPQGLTLGAADEIQSKVTGEPIEDIYARMDKKTEQYPSAVQAGQLTGGLISSAVPVGGALNAARGMGMGGKMAAGGTAGALTAGLEGFNTGRGGFGNRMDNAMEPAPLAVGATLGAAVPMVARGAGAIAARGANPNAAMRATGTPTRAANIVSRAFRDDAASGQDIQQYLDSLGPEGMLADVPGGNLQGQAGAMARLPGPQQGVVRGAVEGRVAGSADRVNATLDENLGAPANMVEEADRLATLRRDTAKPAYDQFRQQQFPMTDEIRDVLRRADALGALDNVRQIGRAEGFDVDMYRDPDALAFNGEMLDEVSKALRDKAKAAGMPGSGQTGMASRFSNLNDQLLQLSPELNRIRNVYRLDSAAMEAADSGRDILNNNVTPDQFRARWENMSQEERLAFQKAARDAIEQRMAGTANENVAGQRILGPRSVQQKVGTAFGDDAPQALQSRVDAERQFQDTRGMVARNSVTAGQQKAMKELAPMVDETGNRMTPWNRARRGAGDVANALIDSVNPRDRSRDLMGMAEALTATGARRDQLVQALVADYLRAQGRQPTARAVEALTTRLLSGAVVPASSATR